MEEEVISELHERNEPVPLPLGLPDMDDIIDAEEQIFLSMDSAMRQFMLTVSDVITGSLEPVTIADPQSHTYLPEVAAEAWSLGLSREMIPLCESNGDYYCVDESGQVLFWQGGEMQEEVWADVWAWAREVWLNS